MVGLSSSVLHPNPFSDSRADPLYLFHLPLLDFSPCSIRKRSLPQDFILLLQTSEVRDHPQGDLSLTSIRGAAFQSKLHLPRCL